MRKIVLLSHGGMAKGLLNTLSIFTANIDQITAISAYVDDCDPKAELESFWASVNDEVFVFSTTSPLPADFFNEIRTMLKPITATTTKEAANII